MRCSSRCFTSSCGVPWEPRLWLDICGLQSIYHFRQNRICKSCQRLARHHLKLELERGCCRTFDLSKAAAGIVAFAHFIQSSRSFPLHFWSVIWSIVIFHQRCYSIDLTSLIWTPTGRLASQIILLGTKSVYTYFNDLTNISCTATHERLWSVSWGSTGRDRSCCN